MVSKIIGKKIVHYNEIDSTNDEAKRLIKADKLAEGGVVIAASQTKGRGKPGSGWFSPAGAGIYLSAVVKPYKNPNDLSPITLLGAKAVVSLIEKNTMLKAKIKEPNDVLLNNRKVAGILVERLADGHLIIGLGLNINNLTSDFPADLKDAATSLRIEKGEKVNLQNFVDLLITTLNQEYLAYLAEI